MITNLWDEPNLRGYAFEYIAKVMLRRARGNNFIFIIRQFDSIQELLGKYRLVPKNEFSDFFEYLSKEWNRCDLMEVMLSNKDDRIIKDIVVYDVKSKIWNVKRDYYEFCESNYRFMKKCASLGIQINIISIIIYNNWRFSFSVIPFDKVKLRIYSRFKS